MINRNDIIYFLGIGGIGMSALARWCKHQGANIYGYDLNSTKLTDELIHEGMQVHFKSDVNKIPENTNLVVYTPAIPKDNAEFKHIRNSNFPLIKRAELIGNITKNYFTIAVAGTHGKTSISAITAHVLKKSGLNISAFVGGVCRNYNSNLILSEKTDYLIIEADEYDRSLLQINPDIAVISSIDEDHLDIYDNHEDIINTFNEFADKLNEKGYLIHSSNIASFKNKYCKILNYGTNEDASTFASNIRIINGKYHIDINTEKGLIKDVEIQVPGKHNIENTLAAVSVAIIIGLSFDQIKLGITSFKGVERRMDYRINNSDIVYIDDYAHHPEEIRNTISTLKELYPEKKITGIFQPHLFSRTRDFADSFAHELNELDDIILMDIYPAREKPISGISSKVIRDKIKNTNCLILSSEEILNRLNSTNPEVILTMGAGDIGLLVPEIEKILLKKC